MTFEEWRSQKKHLDFSELPQEFREAYGYEDDAGGVFLGAIEYPQFAYIEKYPNNEYYLIIGNRDWISNDLDALERRLWNYHVVDNVGGERV